MKTFKERFEEFFYSLYECQQMDLVCTYCDFTEWVDFDSMADWYEWHEQELYRIDRDEWLALEDEDEETDPEE